MTEAQHVQLHVDLGEEQVPSLHGERRGEATKNSNGMRFPCLNCLFSDVSAVLPFGHKFIIANFLDYDVFVFSIMSKIVD